MLGQNQKSIFETTTVLERCAKTNAGVEGGCHGEFLSGAWGDTPFFDHAHLHGCCFWAMHKKNMEKCTAATEGDVPQIPIGSRISPLETHIHKAREASYSIKYAW